MTDFSMGCLLGLVLGIVGTGLLLAIYRLSQPVRPGREPEVSAEDSNALYRALRCLAYTTQSQTADVVELVEAWIAGENVEAVVERIQAENEE